MRTTQKIFAIGVTGLLLFVGCSRAQFDRTNGSERSEGEAAIQQELSEGRTDAIAPATEPAQLGAAARDESLPPIPQVPPGGNLSTGDRVIRNANLSVRIGEGEFQDKFQQANALADRFGGFVAATSTEETEGRIASGTVTLRVPSDKFQEAIAALKELGEVSAEERSGQDVSAQFVDLEARLRHAKTQEAFYLRLIDQATQISEMIQIQQHLSSIQLQIEEIEGRLKFLEDQTSFSTINVRIFEPEAGPPPARGALLDALVRAWEGFQNVVAGVIVGIGWVAPLALVVLVGYGVWRIFRRDKTTPLPESSSG